MMFGSVYSQCLGDMNEDGIKDILDIVNLVNGILDGDDVCEEPSICDSLTEVELWGEWYDIESTNYINLYLWEQGLTSPIPPEIGCLTDLTYLYLESNQITGEIPPEIGYLTNLEYLYLSDNQLTGQIPPGIGNLTNLSSLYLSYNQLTGEIPPEVCELFENNNLDINNILDGNNLINSCE